MGHVFSLSKPADVLHLLAVLAFSVGVISSVVAYIFAIHRRKKGISADSTELSADDRRFLDRFLVSRVSAMTVVYLIALALVFGLAWVLRR